MPDPNEIRLDNLRETLRQIQRYIVLGIGSAIILLSVILQAPDLSKSSATLTLPFIGQVAPSMAAFTLIIAGFIFGAVSVSGVNRVVSIAREIGDESLVDAALTFPTVVTIQSKVLRVGASLMPPILLVLGYMIEHSRTETPFDPFALVGMAMISSPYLVLSYILRKPISERYRMAT